MYPPLLPFGFCLLPFAFPSGYSQRRNVLRGSKQNHRQRQFEMSDTLVGTVKGPGEKPSEFVFITTDNDHTRVGEFVYYVRDAARSTRRILGNVTERRLARSRMVRKALPRKCRILSVISGSR